MHSSLTSPGNQRLKLQPGKRLDFSLEDWAYSQPMNPPTLHKITLTAAALLTSFALAAHGGSATVSSAGQTYGSNRSVNPLHRQLFPTSTYMIDDGSAELGVGFGNGAQNFDCLWFNQFDVIPGQTTIASVSIAWGYPLEPEPGINGTQVIIAIWSDPNGDGDPRDAVLLGSTRGFMLNASTDTFVTYPFSPAITLPAGATSFFVGDETPTNEGPEYWWEALDQTTTLRQSWVAAMSDGSAVDINHVGNNDFLGLIDDFGLPGNWLIRANAGDGSENITLIATVGRQQGKRFVNLSWTPTDGGSVNVTRNGSLIATTDNEGRGRDNLGGLTGDLIYQVCTTDGSGCSNQVRLRIQPHAD